MPSSQYQDQLRAVILAPNHHEKADLLENIQPPAKLGWEIGAIPEIPGRPPGSQISDHPPRLRRGLATDKGRRRFIHSIYNIELNAIDLAALICLRAPDMPRAFHEDFLCIAREESRHAALLSDALDKRDYPAGSMAFHHALWNSACAAKDIGEQLVIIPRFLEARGLDVCADILPRLASIDAELAANLTVIYKDELGHVETGTRWHSYWCAREGLSPERHFREVCATHFSYMIPASTPLDEKGRLAAGFRREELSFLATPKERKDDATDIIKNS